jgi:beta-glucosidase
MTRIFKFPDGFLWGASTSSYQVEGGIFNNDWAYAAKNGRVMPAGSATDHYNRYREDFDIAKSLGHNAHRISIEWARIEPEEGKFDQKEIEHYKNVIQAMKERGIKPFITLWHFTLPIWFANKGGFASKDSASYFSRYCKHVITELNEEGIIWSTINEPVVYATMSYLWGHWPPFELFKLNVFLKVVRNLAKSHNHAYREVKAAHPEVSLGVVKNNMYKHVAKDSRWNPLLHISKWINDWLWNFWFMNKVKDNIDTIGVNYYFHTEFGKKEKYVKSDMGWDLYPEGLKFVLLDLKKYEKPIYITEAGIADKKDYFRAEYIKDLVVAVNKAIENGADVKGFLYWSLLDNYEWIYAYSQKFGLVEVNVLTKERKIRQSAYNYKKICESNSVTT